MSEHERYDPQALLAHMGWLRNLARQLVADQQLADDLAHDTYVIAMERSPSDPAHLRGWLRGVLVRLVSRLRRNELRRQDVELAHAPRERLEAIPWATELVEEKVGGIGRR